MSILLRTVLYSICDLRVSNNILSLSVKVSTAIIKLSQKKKREKREREKIKRQSNSTLESLLLHIFFVGLFSIPSGKSNLNFLAHNEIPFLFLR